MSPSKSIGFGKLLYVPNLIGYARITILALAFTVYYESDALVCGLLLTLSAALDGIDGWAARRYNQASAFGAWFDVVIDNIGRTVMWTWTAPTYGCFVAIVEWLIFACTHSWGSRWKDKGFVSAPNWARAVMANGFKNPLGFHAVAGLHFLPVWLYLHSRTSHSPIVAVVGHWAIGVWLASGRLIALAVEAWCLAAHVTALLAENP
eukprot:Opistho-2@69283